MMLAPEKKIILRCFFEHKLIYLCAKFQLSQTPATVFLPIGITFFANIGLEYFSNNILRVFHQSQLELPDLDQNWARTSPLLLQIFESSNCVDSHIVWWSESVTANCKSQFHVFHFLQSSLELNCWRRDWTISVTHCPIQGSTEEWSLLTTNSLKRFNQKMQLFCCLPNNNYFKNKSNLAAGSKIHGRSGKAITQI